MAEEEKERTWKDWLKSIPRVVIATLWALVTFAAFLIPSILIGGLLPIDQQGLILIGGAFAAFEFAIHLLSKTIFSPALTIAREVVSILVLIVFTNGGVISMVFPLEGMPIQFALDFRPILAVLCILSLLSIAKSMLQIWDLLSEEDEEPEKIT